MTDIRDDDPELWLTYDEAAKRLGIKPDSVRRRAASRKWPRRQGNDGLARIRIPPDKIRIQNPDATPAIIPDNPDEGLRIELGQTRRQLSEAREELAAARAEISGIRERLADTQAERDRLTRLLDRALEPRPVQSVAATTQLGFWARLFGRGA